MPKIVHYLLMEFILSGCAELPEQFRPIRFFHQNATEAQFLLDRNECMNRSVWIKAKGGLRGYVHSEGTKDINIKTRAIFSCDTFSDCLSERGYMETPNGNLEVTRTTEIICSLH